MIFESAGELHCGGSCTRSREGDQSGGQISAGVSLSCGQARPRSEKGEARGSPGKSRRQQRAGGCLRASNDRARSIAPGRSIACRARPRHAHRRQPSDGAIRPAFAGGAWRRAVETWVWHLHSCRPAGPELRSAQLSGGAPRIHSRRDVRSAPYSRSQRGRPRRRASQRRATRNHVGRGRGDVCIARRRRRVPCARRQLPSKRGSGIGQPDRGVARGDGVGVVLRTARANSRASGRERQTRGGRGASPNLRSDPAARCRPSPVGDERAPDRSERAPGAGTGRRTRFTYPRALDRETDLTTGTAVACAPYRHATTTTSRTVLNPNPVEPGRTR